MSKRVVHFKPTAMRRDGVLCGKQVDEFTGRRGLVTCKTCIAKARAGAEMTSE